MVRVIEIPPETKDKTWSGRRVTCPTCRSVLAIERESDVSMLFWHDEERDLHLQDLGFRCPVCYSQVELGFDPTVYPLEPEG